MNISGVDSHCHVYPEAIAARAVEGIGSFYNIPMNLDGTVDCLLKRMDEGHIDHAVISSCATRWRIWRRLRRPWILFSAPSI